MGSNKNGLKPNQVADAAEQCFTRFGVHRTSMADVADGLGVTRQTIYRLFENRTALLEYIADRRITELGRNLKSHFARFTSLEEALVDGSVLSLKAGREDPLLEELVRNSNHDIDQFLFRGSSGTQEIMLELWCPLLDTAREDGQLRDGIDNDEAVEWIRHCHAAATIREDIQPDEQAKMFKTFLVPSIIRD